MSELSPILSLPLIQAAQAQKHVTHNEAVMQLDALVQMTVTDSTLTSPPANPTTGQRHIVASAPTGAWSGQAGKIALWLDGTWQFITPKTGWRAWVTATAQELVYTGSAWQDAAVVTMPSVLNVDGIGISASSDASNRLALSSDASLFNHAGTGHQIKINKASAGQTASLMFQTNFSGRAEIGTLGDNNFGIKVSNNGSGFTTALRITALTAAVEITKPLLLTGQSTEPVNPPDGAIWHDSIRGQLMGRAGGQTRVLDQQSSQASLVPPAQEWLMTTNGAGGAATTLAGAANRMDLFPFVPATDLAMDALSINCTTAVAAALAKVTIYDALANGQPGNLILETGTADLSTVGLKTLPAALSFVRGRTYWLGVRHSSTATLSAWALQATPDLNGGTAPVTTARKTLRRTVTFASAAPTNWGFVSSEINAASGTAIWLRIT
jgi:hypothetical protein